MKKFLSVFIFCCVITILISYFQFPQKKTLNYNNDINLSVEEHPGYDMIRYN